MDLTNGIKH